MKTQDEGSVLLAIFAGAGIAAVFGIENGKTVVTRRTTIVSRLSPAWYWRPMEAIGVKTEHEFLFDELKRRLDGMK
ncbi:MAG TPA: hypothetical protein VIG25_20995 [Pyrinomonadaceae bacterium]